MFLLMKKKHTKNINKKQNKKTDGNNMSINAKILEKQVQNVPIWTLSQGDS